MNQMAFPKSRSESSTDHQSATEYELTDLDFQRIAERVYSIAGIVLESHKRQMIYARLSRRLRALEMSSFRAYLDYLGDGADRKELEAFTNAVTTNLTSFFREAHHFEHLSQEVVGPKAESGTTRLRVWSAGCSTGEEPYSIALSILGAAPSVPADFKVLATDLDTDVLAKGKAGRYDHSKAASIPKALHRYTSRPDGTGLQMSREAMSLITFRQLNLLRDWPMHGPFDVIFCRNVLIYFDAETKMKLIDRFCDLIPNGGFLYLGHSESILEEHPRLASLGRTIYQRRDR